MISVNAYHTTILARDTIKRLNPIPTSQWWNQPLYERHVTKSGRNRVKYFKTDNSWLIKGQAVVSRGGLAPPEFGVSEKRTEREMDRLLLSAPPDLKT